MDTQLSLLSRRDAREQVDAHRLAQRQKLESLSEMAGVLAHQFNNLITGILGHASLCRLSDATDEQVLTGLAEIESITLRASEICKQLSLIAGKGLAGRCPLDLNAIVREAVNQAERTLPRQVQLRLAHAELVPAVAGDERLIRQLLANLLANAVEAFGSDGGEIVVPARSPAASLDDASAELAPVCFDNTPPGLAAGGASLEVADNGPGLAQDVQARLFEPFFSTRSGKRGLGLPTVLGIVRSHGGGIQVLSGPGQGTIVRVYLPLWDGERNESLSRNMSPGCATAPPAEMQRRPLGTILLVDDEKAILEVGSRLLASIGFEVLTAPDGEHAVRLFTEHQSEVRLALIDLTMPRMSGDQIARELRTLSAKLPLVLMSGFQELDIVERLSDLRLSGYLQKPFRLPSLLDLLHRLKLIEAGPASSR